MKAAIPDTSTLPIPEPTFPATLSIRQLEISWELLRSLKFPNITPADLKKLPRVIAERFLAENRIINTDTYNRTMAHIAKTRPDAGMAPATFALQFRRAPQGFMVCSGIEQLVQELLTLPITKEEFNFARDYYKQANIPFFNEEMWRSIVTTNGGVLPLTIRGLRDGSLAFPGETVLTVTGPEELVAHFEHVFHRAYYQSLVASNAAAIRQIIGDPSRFIEVGKRGVPTESQHLRAVQAMYVGGGLFLTSNDAAIGILPVRDVGTIGHRFVQRYPSEEAAFRDAIETLPAVTLLVDLVDTIEGIELALKLKQEYRPTDKKIWVRLDSGDIKAQTLFFLRRTTELGMTDPNKDVVVVEGIESIAELAEIEQAVITEFGEAGRQRVKYGAGELLVARGTNRSDASTGFKLTRIHDQGQDRPTMKFSDSPGKGSYPGKPEILVRADGTRVIEQEDLAVADPTRVEGFETLSLNGAMRDDLGDIEGARRRAERSLHLLARLERAQLKTQRAMPSETTQQLIHEVRQRYGLPTAQESITSR